jgi:hypothetical protein
VIKVLITLIWSLYIVQIFNNFACPKCLFERLSLMVH